MEYRTPTEAEAREIAESLRTFFETSENPAGREMMATDPEAFIEAVKHGVNVILAARIYRESHGL